MPHPAVKDVTLAITGYPVICGAVLADSADVKDLILDAFCPGQLSMRFVQNFCGDPFFFGQHGNERLNHDQQKRVWIYCYIDDDLKVWWFEI